MDTRKYKENLTILIIEDDMVMASKLKRILAKVFYKIIIAKNGKDAYSIFINDKDIDLIISDINMPKMNGLEFLEELRKIDDNIPFIFLTAKNEADEMLKAINFSVSNYLLKPIDLEKLFMAIDKVIKKEIKINKRNKLRDNILIINSDYYWNQNKKVLYKNNQELDLTKKELLFLELLLSFPNRVFTMSNIVDFIWKDDFESKDYNSNLKNMISRLKKKIPNIDISNHYGLGYKIQINQKKD